MNWLKENWFKLGILIVIICLSTFTIYYFNSTIPNRDGVKASTGQVQDQKLEPENLTAISTTPIEPTITPSTTPQSKPSITKTPTQPIQKNNITQPKESTPNPIEQIATSSAVSVTACQNLETENQNLDQKNNIVQNLTLSLGSTFNDLFNYSNDLEYGYQRLLSKKDSFTKQVAQLNKAIDDIPLVSFADISTLKQKYTDGANYKQEAFDSLLLSLQYYNAALGVPNNSYLIQNSQTSLTESKNKSDQAFQSFTGARNYYVQTVVVAYSSKHSNICQTK